MDSENENENEVMNNTETKNMEDNKENIADKSKCAKCLVSTLWFKILKKKNVFDL